MKTTIFVDGVCLSDTEYHTLLYCISLSRQTLLNRTKMNILEKDKTMFRSYFDAANKLYAIVRGE